MWAMTNGRLAVCAAVLLTACAPLRVSSFTEPGVNLAGYRTYSWDETGPGATGDPRLDNNRFFRDRITDAVDRELSARGFERITVGAPDVVVHLHARIAQRLEASTLDPQSATCLAGDCRPQVYDEGTLLLDVIEAGSNRLVWRGWSESGFDGVVADQGRMDAVIDKVVQQILERFPRRAA